MKSNTAIQKNRIIIPENPLSNLLFNDTRTAAVWLIIRIYVGWAWLTAGWNKLGAPAWTGENKGAAVSGYVRGALVRAEEGNVTGWYSTFLESFVLPNATVFSYMVVYGEILVGIGLIVGLFTGIAAFFGGLMNVSFLLAGTISSNPVLFVLATWLVLAWKVAGWYGLDRWALPLAGTPCRRPAKTEAPAADNKTVTPEF